MELVLAVFGIVGSLVGAVVGHVLSDRQAKTQWRHESDVRWLADVRTHAAAILSGALELDKSMRRKSIYLDHDDDRTERLPGYVSVFHVPNGGLDGILSEELRVELMGFIVECRRDFDRLQQSTVALELVTEGPEVEAARVLLNRLSDAIWGFETFAPFGQVLDATNEVGMAREALVVAARASLRPA